jgi:Protein of unknown function (DUF2721)
MAVLVQNSMVNDVPRLFQALVAPAIFVSAAGLLLLSLNTRLMGMVSRLRQYLHEKHSAVQEGRLAEAEAYASRIASIESRAEMIRRAFMLTLISLTGTITSCLLLGTALYFEDAALFAAVVFIISILALLFGSIYYLREVGVALTSVRDEAADSRFMDLTTSTDLADQETVLKP